MSIKYITYEYNNSGLLVRELYYYNARLKDNAEPNKIWLNEYVYDSEGKLIKTRYRFNIDDKKWDNTRDFDHLNQEAVSELRYSKRHPILK